MNPSRAGLLKFVCRMIAWGSVLTALGWVIASYDSLPEVIRLTRWKSAEKSWLIALRVPLINLFSLGLIEVLGRSVARLKVPGAAQLITPVLLLTVGIKGAVEGWELVHLPNRHFAAVLVLGLTVLTGVLVASRCAESLLKNGNVGKLKLTGFELFLVTIFVAGIILLNVPLVTQSL